MPSIVVDLKDPGLTPREARLKGMILLGETFNRFFMQIAPKPPGKPQFSPIRVLDETFKHVVAVPNTVLKHIFLNVEYELKYKGITTAGNKIKFDYKNPPAGALLPKSVKIKPVEDDFDPTEPRSYLMTAAFSGKRTDLLQDYLADTVDDIIHLGDDLDDARKYTLASLTFSRCK